MKTLEYAHVDVFAEAAYRGNSLPVFVDPGDLSTEQMQLVTRELRHFEAIFVSPTEDPSTWRARVFDLLSELPFAGHPLIGACAVLHRASATDDARSWRIELPGREVQVSTRPRGRVYEGVLDQGRPEFFGSSDERIRIAQAFDLDARDIRDDLPCEVISTGLRYLVVPVRAGVLDRARVAGDITELVRSTGAEFAALFDEEGLELRHRNNDGLLEDVATASAAGTIGAYRLRHGLAPTGREFQLHQGCHVGRPSALTVRAEGTPHDVERVVVGGPVAFVGTGSLEVPP